MTESRLTWFPRKWSDVVGGAYSKIYLPVAWRWKWSMVVYPLRLAPVRWLIKTFCKIHSLRTDYRWQDAPSFRSARKDVIAESERNLRLQLAVETGLRKGRCHSYAGSVNANPQFWKYTWRIFVTPTGGDDFVPKQWVWAMPELKHAEFRRRYHWLRDNRINFYISNRRHRREHPLWDPEAKVIQEEPMAVPAFDDDPDDIADDGRK